jgi:hypothetical protein
VQATLGPGHAGLRQGLNGLAAGVHCSQAGADDDPGRMASAVAGGDARLARLAVDQRKERAAHRDCSGRHIAGRVLVS